MAIMGVNATQYGDSLIILKVGHGWLSSCTTIFKVT